VDLSGTYTNELRSVMILRQDDDANLRGSYHSLVGRDPGIRPLRGRTGDPDGSRQMLAFSVCFIVKSKERGTLHSTCAWCGWAKHEPTSTLIETHWLLTSSPASDDDEWSSHLIGEDEFLRIGDAPDEAHEQEFLSDLDSIKKMYQDASRG
jgi:hypothetical protein